MKKRFRQTYNGGPVHTISSSRSKRGLKLFDPQPHGQVRHIVRDGLPVPATPPESLVTGAMPDRAGFRPKDEPGEQLVNLKSSARAIRSITAGERVETA